MESEIQYANRASHEQRKIMVEFMRTHPALLKGEFVGHQGAIEKAKMWAELAQQLNADGTGSTKTADRWMKSWQDWRSLTKKKGAALANHAGGTGGGPAKKSRLTDIEVELLGLIGRVAVTGHTNVPDALERQLHEEQPDDEVPQLATVESEADVEPHPRGASPDHLVATPSTDTVHPVSVAAVSGRVRRKKRSAEIADRYEEQVLSAAESQAAATNEHTLALEEHTAALREHTASINVQNDILRRQTTLMEKGVEALRNQAASTEVLSACAQAALET